MRGCAGSRGDTRGGGTKGDDAAPRRRAERRSFVPPRGFVECIHRRATAVRRGGVDPRAARARLSRSFPNSEHWSNFLAKRVELVAHEAEEVRDEGEADVGEGVRQGHAREDDAGVADEVGDVEVDVVVSLEEPGRGGTAPRFRRHGERANEPASGADERRLRVEVGERRGADANKTRVATGSAPVLSPPGGVERHCTRRIDLQLCSAARCCSSRDVHSVRRLPTLPHTHRARDPPRPVRRAARARDDPRRTTPRPPSPAPSLLPRLPAPPLPRAPAAVGSDRARPLAARIAPSPAMVARDDRTSRRSSRSACRTP